jgi:hypothetical protein
MCRDSGRWHIEDTEDYRDFEAAIIADYEARTAVERELVLRLASLLWRLRRATAIETDLLRIQAEMLASRHPSRGLSGNRSVSAVVHDLPLASTEIKSNELTIGSVEPFGKVTGASGDRQQMTHTFQRLPTSPTEFHPAPQHRIARARFLWPSTRSSCRSKPQDRPFAA